MANNKRFFTAMAITIGVIVIAHKGYLGPEAKQLARNGTFQDLYPGIPL